MPIETGKELMNIASHKYAIHHNSPELQSAKEAELIGAFLQSVMVWDDIGLNGRIQAEFSMTEEIAQLREVGLVVYATARNHILEGGVGAPSPWLVAYVVIWRSDDKSYP